MCFYFVQNYRHFCQKQKLALLFIMYHWCAISGYMIRLILLVKKYPEKWVNLISSRLKYSASFRTTKLAIDCFQLTFCIHPAQTVCPPKPHFCFSRDFLILIYESRIWPTSPFHRLWWTWFTNTGSEEFGISWDQICDTYWSWPREWWLRRGTSCERYREYPSEWDFYTFFRRSE